MLLCLDGYEEGIDVLTSVSTASATLPALVVAFRAIDESRCDDAASVLPAVAKVKEQEA